MNSHADNRNRGMLITRKELTMPKWVTEQSDRVGPKPPPPPSANENGHATIKQPNLPPKTKTQPEPDYEIIEFSNQQYSNAPIRPNSSNSGSKTPDNKLKCTLCGSGNPWVTCEECAQQIFCASCDDMFHKHPKRKNHQRKAIEMSLPPLPPKVLPGQPGPTAPVAPPRRNKRGFMTPIMQRKDQGNAMPGPFPVSPSPTRSMKNSSWQERFGSLPRGLNLLNRPLPETPKTPSESSRSNTPKSVFDNIQRPPSVALEKIKSKANATLDRMQLLQQRYRQQKEQMGRDRNGSATDQNVLAFDQWSSISQSPSHFRSDSMSSGINSSHLDLMDDTNFNLFHQRQPSALQHHQMVAQRANQLGQRAMSNSVFNINQINRKQPITTNGWMNSPLQQAQSMAQLNCANCAQQHSQWNSPYGHHMHMNQDPWSNQLSTQQHLNRSNMSLNVPAGYMMQSQMNGMYPPPTFMNQRGVMHQIYPQPYVAGMPVMNPGLIGMPPSTSRAASRAGSRMASPAMSRKSVTLRRKQRSTYIDNDATDDEDSDDDDRRSITSTRSGVSRSRQRRMSSSSQLQLDDDIESRAKLHRHRARNQRRDSIAKSVQNDWAPGRSTLSNNNRSADSGFNSPLKPSRIYSDLDSEGSGTRALVQAKIEQKLKEESLKRKQSKHKRQSQSPLPQKASAAVQTPAVKQKIKQEKTENNEKVVEKPVKQMQEALESDLDHNKVKNVAEEEEENKEPVTEGESESEQSEETEPEQLEENEVQEDDLGPPPSTPDHEWECEFCTFVNEANIKICSICCKTPSIKPKKAIKSTSPPKNIKKERTHSKPNEKEKPKENEIFEDKNGTIKRAPLTTSQSSTSSNIQNKGSNNLQTRELDSAHNTDDGNDTLQKKETVEDIWATLDENIQVTAHEVTRKAESKTACNTSSKLTSADRQESNLMQSQAREIGTSPPPQSISTQTYDTLPVRKSEAREETVAKSNTQHLYNDTITQTSFPSFPKKQDLKSFEAEVLNKIHNISHVPSQHHNHHHANHPTYSYNERQRYRSNNDLRMDDAMSMDFETFNGLGRRQPSIGELMLLQKTSSQIHSPAGGSIYDLPYRELVSLKLNDMENHKESDLYKYTTEELNAALKYCGPDVHPLVWLRDNWPKLIQTVQSLATKYGQERAENTIGTISQVEARDALRMHTGNIWQAVSECIEQRQCKYRDIFSKGNFSREDIVTALTTHQGNVDLALLDLGRTQLKPYLMRIWGSPGGVENESGSQHLPTTPHSSQSTHYNINKDIHNFLSANAAECIQTPNATGAFFNNNQAPSPFDKPPSFNSPLENSNHNIDTTSSYSADSKDFTNNTPPLDESILSNKNMLKDLETLIGNMENNQKNQNEQVLRSIQDIISNVTTKTENDYDSESMRILTKSPITTPKIKITHKNNNSENEDDVKTFVWQHIQEIVPDLVQQVEMELMEENEEKLKSENQVKTEDEITPEPTQIAPPPPPPIDQDVFLMEEVIKPNIRQAFIREELPQQYVYTAEIATFQLAFDKALQQEHEEEFEFDTLKEASKKVYRMLKMSETQGPSQIINLEEIQLPVPPKTPTNMIGTEILSTQKEVSQDEMPASTVVQNEILQSANEISSSTEKNYLVEELTAVHPAIQLDSLTKNQNLRTSDEINLEVNETTMKNNDASNAIITKLSLPENTTLTASKTEITENKIQKLNEKLFLEETNVKHSTNKNEILGISQEIYLNETNTQSTFATENPNQNQELVNLSKEKIIYTELSSDDKLVKEDKNFLTENIYDNYSNSDPSTSSTPALNNHIETALTIEYFNPIGDSSKIEKPEKRNENELSKTQPQKNNRDSKIPSTNKHIQHKRTTPLKNQLNEAESKAKIDTDFQNASNLIISEESSNVIVTPINLYEHEPNILPNDYIQSTREEIENKFEPGDIDANYLHFHTPSYKEANKINEFITQESNTNNYNKQPSEESIKSKDANENISSLPQTPNTSTEPAVISEANILKNESSTFSSNKKLSKIPVRRTASNTTITSTCLNLIKTGSKENIISQEPNSLTLANIEKDTQSSKEIDKTTTLLTEDESEKELHIIESDTAETEVTSSRVHLLQSPSNTSEMLLVIQQEGTENNSTIAPSTSNSTLHSTISQSSGFKSPTEFIPSGDPSKQNLSELVEDTQRLIKQMKDEISIDDFESSTDEYTDEYSDDYDDGEEEEDEYWDEDNESNDDDEYDDITEDVTEANEDFSNEDDLISKTQSPLPSQESQDHREIHNNSALSNISESSHQSHALQLDPYQQNETINTQTNEIQNQILSVDKAEAFYETENNFPELPVELVRDNNFEKAQSVVQTVESENSLAELPVKNVMQHINPLTVDNEERFDTEPNLENKTSSFVSSKNILSASITTANDLETENSIPEFPTKIVVSQQPKEQTIFNLTHADDSQIAMETRDDGKAIQNEDEQNLTLEQKIHASENLSNYSTDNSKTSNDLPSTSFKDKTISKEGQTISNHIKFSGTSKNSEFPTATKTDSILNQEDVASTSNAEQNSLDLPNNDHHRPSDIINDNMPSTSNVFKSPDTKKKSNNDVKKSVKKPLAASKIPKPKEIPKESKPKELPISKQKSVSKKKLYTRSKSFSGPPTPIGIASVKTLTQKFISPSQNTIQPTKPKNQPIVKRKSSITEAINKFTKPSSSTEKPIVSSLFKSRTQPRIPKKKYHETCFSDDDYESSTSEEELEPLEIRQRKLSVPVFRAYPSMQEPADVNTEELVDKFMKEELTSTIAEAQIAAALVSMKFPQDVSLWAAKECSDLDHAIALLKQECELCSGTYPLNQIVSMLKCTHKCCKQCAKTYFTVQITERSINDCSCPYCKLPELHNPIEHEDENLEYFSNLDIFLKNILEPEVHELFQRKLRDRTLLKDPNFKWCVQCSSGFFARPKQKRLICPDCGSVTCAQCRKAWQKQHEGISCDQYLEWEAANDPEIQAKEVQKHLEQNGIDCPKCKFKYSLARGGCMHFTCTQCKYEFCYGCAKPFMMGAKCNISPYCAKLGLHAHHPRNCLFYLRDKLPVQLQILLKNNGESFEVDPLENAENANDNEPSSSNKKELLCPIPIQKETPTGLVDTRCNGDVPEKHAGMCRTHYVEYLTAKVAKAKIDPLPIFDLTDCVQELRRRGIALPERGPWDTDEIYKTMCAEVIQKNIPLEMA